MNRIAGIGAAVIGTGFIGTVHVEAFISWSACTTRSASIARAATSDTAYRSHGTANIMLRKLPA